MATIKSQLDLESINMAVNQKYDKVVAPTDGFFLDSQTIVVTTQPQGTVLCATGTCDGLYTWADSSSISLSSWTDYQVQKITTQSDLCHVFYGHKFDHSLTVVRTPPCAAAISQILCELDC